MKKSVLRQEGELLARWAILPPVWGNWLDCMLLEGRAEAKCTSLSPGNLARGRCSINIMS